MRSADEFASRTAAADNERVNFAAIAIVFSLFAMLLVTVIAYPRAGFVVVISPPGNSEGQTLSIIAEAGGQFVSSSAMPWIAVAYSENPQFARSAKNAGALLVIASPLLAGCLSSRPTL
ncbi:MULTISPECIES: hypothetical protein [unclassified Rhizobium]|uniref:hypothetical protein n=1 Tax=unclassified Rhizobium TaxID=2613769 RepID=UPI00135BC0FA|nr:MULTISPECIES: hypothetical protein [unclassified Rhizobium]